ncbi:ribosome biogenesis protein tsr1 [Coemansia sp. RSA 1813]|nr:ribosome biogenesis protein tsr1 [Coemansia sp. RSA 1843]KAJ2090553.1 ribosome biogenesis protein tsr1 [Coemansia sp. RSA 986]KAJ2216359.1 ribosome biogenesis protein tsr1 [Coemansia sp. RSA 487]KAJ2570856.1 ribosome biogenesis protein tsr1 [Coemansia sp. RSA 1813]
MAKEQQKQFHHRSSLTQKNKPFKRRFATKNSLRDKSKGRTQRASIKGKVLRKHSRLDRRHALRVEQRKKREQIAFSTRIFSGRHRTPKVVAVVPLCADTDVSAIVRGLYQCVDEQYPEDAKKTCKLLDVVRFKQTIQFVEVGRNLLDILDAAKVADYLIMGLSADVEVDAFGEQCLKAIQNQGHAGVFPIVQGIEAVVPKRRNDVKKSLQSFMDYFFPDIDKVFTTESESESLAVLRMITAQVPKKIKWRRERPYILADNIEFQPSIKDPQVGRLALTGYLRGGNLSANRLVHLPNFGDFQIDTIYHVPVALEVAKGNAIEEDDEPVVIDQPNAELQDSLVEANEPDQMNNEQTWPDDEEMGAWKEQMEQMEEEERKIAAGRERVVRVPKGVSSYQAAWILANEGDEEGSESGSDASDYSDDDSDDMMDESGSGESDEDENEYKEFRVDEGGKIIDGNENASAAEDAEDDEEGLLSAEENAAQLRAYLKEREKQNRDNLQFPDEVDTPLDVPARTRFARYRGMQSFRTSPWDPYENLPLDYGRIFQFENLKHTHKRVLRMTEDAPAKAGMHVRIILNAVPAKAAAAYSPNRPFVAFGLMQHEHQMSVVHFTISRSEDYTAPVRSKDPMVIHFGFRRYNVHPLFSQHTQGGSTTNNVHKFERFLQHGAVSVGTIFAPIQFGTVPVSMYLPTPAGADADASPAMPTLVGTGTSLEVNPSRILAKRIMLTGAPFKVNKRGAVIRYMFFNPEDINWFKPIQIHTKHGRVGHIMESLGTHGYMKCVFDGPMKQMDTVCMNLYKRVFPKWNTSLWSEYEQDGVQRKQWAVSGVDQPSTGEEMEI